MSNLVIEYFYLSTNNVFGSPGYSCLFFLNGTVLHELDLTYAWATLILTVLANY